jgi:spore coat protein U-like protein
MIALILLLAAFAAPLPAQLPEQFTLQTVPGSITGTFQENVETSSTQNFTVRVQNKPPNPAGSYFVTFSPGQSGDFASRQASDGLGNYLIFQIYDSLNPTNRNVLKDLTGSPTSSEVISGTYLTQNPPQNFNHTFYVVIPGNQAPAAGTYTDTLAMSLYQGTIGSYVFGETKTVPISFTVPSLTILKMSRVPDGSAFDELSLSLNLNFGTVFLGASQAADLIVRSNVTYTVEATSTNGGRMKDLIGSDTVPYTFKVGTNTVTLPAGTPAVLASGAGPTPIEGTIYDLSFTIGDFATAAPGDYADTVSFTVTAN